MLTVKTQSCLSSPCVSIVILFFVLDKCDFYFLNPSWLPRLLAQLILLIMSHFSLHSYAESACSVLSAIAWLFFSQVLQGCLYSSPTFEESFHSTNFHHSFIQFSNKWLGASSHSAHQTLEEFCAYIHAVPPYFCFRSLLKTLPC